MTNVHLASTLFNLMKEVILAFTPADLNALFAQHGYPGIVVKSCEVLDFGSDGARVSMIAEPNEQDLFDALGWDVPVGTFVIRVDWELGLLRIMDR